jgi:hypothetical protein
MRKTSFALVLVLGIVDGIANADPIISKTGGVQVEVPEGYNGVAALDRMLKLTDPTDSLAIHLFVVDARNFTHVIKALEKELNTKTRNLRWRGVPNVVVLNGMQGVSTEADATINGQAVKVGGVILKTPTNKYLCIVGIVNAAKEEGFATAMKGIFQSVKPL